MKKILVIILIFCTLLIYGQSNNDKFFTMKEIRLPQEYKVIMDSMVIPYINQKNYDKRNTVVSFLYEWAYLDLLEITVETMSLSDYNYSSYYQYYDSILIISSHPEFGKYIVPDSQRLFMKTQIDPVIMDYDPPFWRVVRLDGVWGIIHEPRL